MLTEHGKVERLLPVEMLDQAARTTGPKLRELLEAEAKALTDAGNHFQIRHSETTQERLHGSEHVDYLFHRLFSMLYLLLRASGRLG